MGTQVIRRDSVARARCALLLGGLLVGCAGESSEAATCGEAVESYGAKAGCPLDGVRVFADLSSWCARAGALAPLGNGFSTCSPYVIIDLADGRALHYAQDSGKLVAVTSRDACLAGEPPACSVKSGVGFSCSTVR